MKIGESNEVSCVVTAAQTAEAVGSGGMTVFGTPFLAALMENAAFTYMQERLPEGRSSVGTRLEISHTSPTPVGMKVTARAEVTGISPNGKLVDFKVTAWDEAGPIGEGSHQRAVIGLERFLAKCEAKRGEAKD